MKLKIKRLRESAIIPKYEHETDTGADLYIAAIKRRDKSDNTFKNIVSDRYALAPFETVMACVGFSVEFPKGYDMQIRPTSGNSLKTPLRVANTPGTIDSGYRGEIAVIIQNVSLEPFMICKGDKIAQMVFSKFEIADIEIVDELNDSDRGEAGWGSTGIAGVEK